MEYAQALQEWRQHLRNLRRRRVIVDRDLKEALFHRDWVQANLKDAQAWQKELADRNDLLETIRPRGARPTPSQAEWLNEAKKYMPGLAIDRIYFVDPRSILGHKLNRRWQFSAA